MNIEVCTQPRACDLQVISDGIAEFNYPFLPNDSDFESGSRFALFAHNESGHIIGGIQASPHWNYCVIELLWVSKENRNTGLGHQLMHELEHYAKEKGFQSIRTETLDFQAKPFYEKLGYKVYGQIDNAPKGHSTYFLIKEIE